MGKKENRFGTPSMDIIEYIYCSSLSNDFSRPWSWSLGLLHLYSIYIHRRWRYASYISKKSLNILQWVHLQRQSPYRCDFNWFNSARMTSPRCLIWICIEESIQLTADRSKLDHRILHIFPASHGLQTDSPRRTVDSWHPRRNPWHNRFQSSPGLRIEGK
jgi:hypothetical protein